MLGRIVVALVVVALGAPVARGQYVEPPPSPPREDAVRAVPQGVEPPTATGAGEKPSTSTSTATEAATNPAAAIANPAVTATATPTATATATPTPTPTATPTATPTPSTTTSTTTTTSTSTSTTTSTTTEPPATTATTATPPAYEPYSPPGMTWAAPPVDQGHQDQDPSRPSTPPIVAGELGFGALATAGGGMVELSLLADLGRLALGGLVTAGGVNEHLGVGVHLAGGPRFALGSARLDLQLDAGLVLFGDDGDEPGFTGSTETSGSDAVLPAVGARLGVTFQSARTGWFLSVGAGIRHVRRETVPYTVTDCKLFSGCVTTPATADYGGTIAGGYLTFGRSYPWRR